MNATEKLAATYLTILRDTTDHLKVKRFAEKQIKYTIAEIRQELERDEGLDV
jgi:predicted ArsR family transcriptional regulator